MTLDTFTFPARIGTSGTFEPVVRSVQFGDGYTQTSGDGINSRKENWPLSFVGYEADIKPIISFLEEHKGYRSFKWTNPLGDLGLYLSGPYTVQANGAYFSLSVTFTLAYHP